MLRFDLAAAGIPYENDRGEDVDFHGLRTSFVTNLARAACIRRSLSGSPGTAITLTMDVFTNLDTDDLRAGVEALRGNSAG